MYSKFVKDVQEKSQLLSLDLTCASALQSPKDSIMAPPFITPGLPKGNLSRLQGTLISSQKGYLCLNADTNWVLSSRPWQLAYTMSSSARFQYLSYPACQGLARNIWAQRTKLANESAGTKQLLLPNHVTAIARSGTSIFVTHTSWRDQ